MTASTDDGATPPDRNAIAGATFEIVVRSVVGLALLWYCLTIVAPFLHAVLWGAFLAVALFGPFQLAVRAFGGRTRMTAITFALIGIAVIVLPAVLLSTSLASGAHEFAESLRAGRVDVPPPDRSVADWPVIGGKLFQLWSAAAADVSELTEYLSPHLKAAAKILLGVAGSFAGAILQAVLAIVIAAAFLAHSDWAGGLSRSLASRLVGRRGTDFARIATVTIRGVARGVLGVALIQSTLAGLGFAVVGLPGAGLIAVVLLVMCIVQVPAALIMVPTILYVFSVEPTTTATIYTVWAVAVSLSDNFLKPFLFGNDVETPVLVLLIGSIGGMIAWGVVGLFTGAVVLALGYELVHAWVHGESGVIDGATGDADTPATDAPAADTGAPAA